jgi:hypothetical protein
MTSKKTSQADKLKTSEKAGLRIAQDGKLIGKGVR